MSKQSKVRKDTEVTWSWGYAHAVGWGPGQEENSEVLFSRVVFFGLTVISLVKDYLPLNSAYCFYLLCMGFAPWLYPREIHPKPKGYFQVAAMTIKHLSGEIMAILGS